MQSDERHLGQESRKGEIISLLITNLILSVIYLWNILCGDLSNWREIVLFLVSQRKLMVFVLHMGNKKKASNE